MQSSTRFVLLVLVIFLNRVTSEVEFDDTPWYEEDEEKLQPRIWHGSKGFHEEHNYIAQVTVKIPTGFTAVCGGVLVTPQMVLTSNQCAPLNNLRNLREIQVRYGTSKRGTTSGHHKEFGEGIDHALSGHYILTERQNMFLADDYSPELALLRLKEPIRHRTFIINLPKPGEEKEVIDESIDLTLLGLGSSLGNDTKWILKEVNVTGVKPCINETETPYALCSRDQQFAACLGDEGSPLLLRDEGGAILFGILSRSNCCYGDTEESLKDRLIECYIVYGRVSAVMPWILDTILAKTRCHCLDELDEMWSLMEDLSNSYDYDSY